MKAVLLRKSQLKTKKVKRKKLNEKKSQRPLNNGVNNKKSKFGMFTI